MKQITLEQFMDGYQALKLAPRVQTIYQVFFRNTEAIEFTNILFQHKIIEPITEVINNEQNRLEYDFVFAPDADERCREFLRKKHFKKLTEDEIKIVGWEKVW